MATQFLDDDATRTPAGKTPASLVPLVYDELRALARRYLAPAHRLLQYVSRNSAMLRRWASRRFTHRSSCSMLCA